MCSRLYLEVVKSGQAQNTLVYLTLSTKRILIARVNRAKKQFQYLNSPQPLHKTNKSSLSSLHFSFALLVS